MAVGGVPTPFILQGIAVVCLIWSCIVYSVQIVGIFQIFRYHSAPHPKPVSPSLKEEDVPHITIIRPVKGVEIGLYECLASTFQLAYPRSKLTVYLCVASASDPAYPVLQKVLADFPGFDAKLLVEEDDPILHGARGHVNNLGPNPKIRNISRAYREAKGDIIWIVDCNVWTAKHAAGRMVDKLFGFQPDGGRTTPYKFVHQLPLVVDLDTSRSEESQALLSPGEPGLSQWPAKALSRGGRLEEMFMSTTHAKFYSAINTVGIAPCIVGKSNMFRKSHLDTFTDPSLNPILSDSDASRGRGIDFFSSYICEDHLIGDLIFRSYLPRFRNHGLVFGEVAIQPMSGMSVSAYIARRVRWLRVRKWTVLVATLVEPGVESFLCCTYFSFALTTLPWFHTKFGIPPTWGAMGAIWLFMVTAWMIVDRIFGWKLHTCQSIEVDEDTPTFARGSIRQGGPKQRPFFDWLGAWLGREMLALPIWIWAVLLGTTVSWRGRQFRVRMDMSVVEIKSPEASLDALPTRNGISTPRSRSKDRVD
ncbi:glycosyltransferase family 21 protein [Cercophora newfieldiana]|uniref:Ceramide glucosyltransferase n=1 Tax=Cercophora newfieldiana TaxID=92897 RepID=A0AA39YH63_9PEZI|nr:glycosyltransferase family 21 protein [Cercophora newfieldiana]